MLALATVCLDDLVDFVDGDVELIIPAPVRRKPGAILGDKGARLAHTPVDVLELLAGLLDERGSLNDLAIGAVDEIRGVFGRFGRRENGQREVPEPLQIGPTRARNENAQ